MNYLFHRPGEKLLATVALRGNCKLAEHLPRSRSGRLNVPPSLPLFNLHGEQASSIESQLWFRVALTRQKCRNHRDCILHAEIQGGRPLGQKGFPLLDMEKSPELGFSSCSLELTSSGRDLKRSQTSPWGQIMAWGLSFPQLRGSSQSDTTIYVKAMSLRIHFCSLPQD